MSNQPVLPVINRNIHYKWSRNLDPVATVPSGSEVVFDLVDCLNNRITAQSSVADIGRLDFAQVDPGVGPVAVHGAEPGDVLRIDVVELTPFEFGWTAVLPGFGLLADEFPEPRLKIWDLASHATDGYTEFNKGIRVPTRPFLGIMVVAPPTDEELSTIPPYPWGGNIDCKHLTAGSTLYLPVQTPGALFSCGDGHAAQGDGEVCGTAIETRMKARLRLTVEKNKPWVQSGHYLTSSQCPADSGVRGQAYAAMGIDRDLAEATRKSVRGILDWLVGEKGLERYEAYMLCSVVGDLKIVQAVDMPHYSVSCAIPLSIFTSDHEA